MSKIIIKIFVAFLIMIMAKIIISAIEKILDKNIYKGLASISNKKRNETVIKLLKNAIKFVLYFIAIIFILNMFGINTSSILATAGIGGIAIAFGAQSLVQDVISGMIILMEDSYSVGDYVNIDGIEGTVMELGMRRTIIQDYDMSYILIPNGDISKIRNYSRDNTRADILVPISYNISYDKVEEIINEISEELENDPNIIDGPTLMGIDDFTDFSYKIKVSSIVATGQKFPYMRKYRKMVVEKFNERGYDFPTDSFFEGVDDEKI